MNIPEEYRERYDSLARSHPWMREMRDEWMQSDFVNCGNPYREGDAVLDATIITSMRDETNGIPSETNGIAYDSPLVEPSEGDAVAILREASGSDVSNLLLINTTKSYDVEEAYTKLADMVERNYVRLSEYERACHDAQTLYLQAEAERDEWKAKAEGYAEALEKLGCSVLANGTVFPPPSYDGADSRERLEADIIDRSEQCRTILGNLRDGLNTVTVSVDVVRGWLDRQAAITEREHPGLTISDDESLINWRGRNYLPQSRALNAERERDEFSLKLKHEMELNRDNRNAHDLEQIDELTAERDDLQGRVDYLESRHCEWSDPNDLGDGCMLRHDELVDKLRAERDKLIAERDEWKAKAESAAHNNPYVGLVRGKQWERKESSDYYCGKCGWKVTDHDSYCPECGGALHRAPNQPTSQSDAPKTEETAENDASKDEIRDFDDSREKLEADVQDFIGDSPITDYSLVQVDYWRVLEWLDRQDAITTKRLSSQSDEQESGEIAANDTAKCEIHDFDDAREKLVNMPYHNGEKQVKLMGKEYEFAIIDELHDTREKLEEDANGYVVSWWQSDWVDSFGHANSMKRDIMHLLDRQAAITEREWEVEQKYLNDGYKEQIDELIAEVDAYRSKYDDMEFIVPIEKAMEFTTDPPGYVKKALADMHERIITLTAECGEYREKLSRALDLAHEIGRLQP